MLLNTSSPTAFCHSLYCTCDSEAHSPLRRRSLMKLKWPFARSQLATPACGVGLMRLCRRRIYARSWPSEKSAVSTLMMRRYVRIPSTIFIKSRYAWAAPMTCGKGRGVYFERAEIHRLVLVSRQAKRRDDFDNFKQSHALSRINHRPWPMMYRRPYALRESHNDIVVSKMVICSRSKRIIVGNDVPTLPATRDMIIFFLRASANLNLEAGQSSRAPTRRH